MSQVARRIARRIFERFDERRSLRLVDAIEQAIEELGLARGSLATSEMADRVRPLVEAQLSGLLTIAEGHAERVPFSMRRELLIGTTLLIAPLEATVRRWTRNELIEAIKSLDSNQFELLGQRLLPLLGIMRVVRTPQSRDGGVDYFGELKLPFQSRLATSILIGAEFKTREIGAPDLRAFEEGVDRQHFLRAANSPKSKIPLTIEVKRRTPALYMVFCGDRFTSDAIAEAEDDGILIFEPGQIANLLYDQLNFSNDVIEELERFCRA